MPGAAGSKYRIQQEGVPTIAKERALQKINDLSPKDCPFCGHAGELVHFKTLILFGALRYYCECSNQECDVMPATGNKKTVEEAIKIWNIRSDFSQR